MGVSFSSLINPTFLKMVCRSTRRQRESRVHRL